MMKKERYFNAYLFNNLVESKQHIAFVQVADKNGIEELTIRICDKKIIAAFADSAPPQNEERKDFAALQLSGDAVKTIPIQENFKLQIYDLLLFPVMNGSKEEDHLIFTSNAGIHIFENNFNKKILLQQTAQYAAVYTGLVANQMSVYTSNLNGKIDKVTRVVASADQNSFMMYPFVDLKKRVARLGIHKKFLYAGLEDGSVSVLCTDQEKELTVVQLQP